MAGTTINPYRFGGQVGYRRDGANRTYVRARHLDTSRGRWVSRDRVDIDAAGFNFYWYVNNRPTTLVDASGLFTIDTSVGGIPNARLTCFDSSDRVSIASGLEYDYQNSLCTALKHCPNARKNSGDECVTINAGFWGGSPKLPAGPLEDCCGKKYTPPGKPNPTLVPINFGSQFVSAKPMFNSRGQCQLSNIPRSNESIGRTSVCITGGRACILTVPDPSDTCHPSRGLTGKTLCALMKKICGGKSYNLDGSGSTQWAISSELGECFKGTCGDGRNDEDYLLICG